jgi:hypothetical protein
MKIILSVLLVVALVLYQLDKELPRFFIFKPARLQELAQASISRHGDNVTALLYDLNHSLREEYGERHVMPFTTDPSKWMWR